MTGGADTASSKCKAVRARFQNRSMLHLHELQVLRCVFVVERDREVVGEQACSTWVSFRFFPCICDVERDREVVGNLAYY